MRTSAMVYRWALLFLVPLTGSMTLHACGLEAGGFGSLPPAGDAATFDHSTPSGNDGGDGGVQSWPDAGADADSGPRTSCPAGSFLCGDRCVSRCAGNCGEASLGCKVNNECIASCSACGGATRECYRCDYPDFVVDGVCEQPIAGDCFGGTYTPCNCNEMPSGPNGDPSRCPGKAQVCLHLNEQTYTCKACGELDTNGKKCGRDSSRTCQVASEEEICK